MTIGNIASEKVIARLEMLLHEVWDSGPAGPVDSDASLLSLGVDSLTLALLFDRIATEFGISWTAENSAVPVNSLRSIADLIVTSLPDSFSDR